ncbi:N-acetylglucosamine kinase [Paremcibacter congregatus]|uniref:ATPase n=1 Tax=Paremcibacter congregatus TaxID=2043170 RepID=A0A2G4YTM6_9PROT|nr:BadF/BadG/BcrA/BcrD ATPase family protein [Paremcibacter congregatus]PHZ84806.1 ATPase [Paremcibacter congregatus]QDE26219.1 ATPase [Paremcibacter congregatus]
MTVIISRAEHNQYFIGIDGGASKCRARLVSSDFSLRGEGLAGPANPLHGIEEAQEAIVASTAAALKDAGLPESDMKNLIAGVGLAGVNLPTCSAAMSNWDHPFKKMFLTTDLHVACIGAHQGADGAVIIVGTGSCGISCVKGKTHILGAHGFPHGDKASGAWLGLEGLKVTLLALDGVLEHSYLTDRIMQHLGCKTDLEVVEKMSRVSSRVYAKLAPLVFEAADHDDAQAQAILREAADYIKAISDKLLDSNPPRLSMIGGLTERMMRWLDKDVAARFSPPLDPPEVGAVYYAHEELFGYHEAV